MFLSPSKISTQIRYIDIKHLVCETIIFAFIRSEFLVKILINENYHNISPYKRWQINLYDIEMCSLRYLTNAYTRKRKKSFSGIEKRKLFLSFEIYWHDTIAKFQNLLCIFFAHLIYTKSCFWWFSFFLFHFGIWKMP